MPLWSSFIRVEVARFYSHPWKWFTRKRQHSSSAGLQTTLRNRSLYWAVAEVIHDTWVAGSSLHQWPCVETELKKQHCQHGVLRRSPSVHFAPCSASRYVKLLVQYSKILRWMEFLFKYVIPIDIKPAARFCALQLFLWLYIQQQSQRISEYASR